MTRLSFSQYRGESAAQPRDKREVWLRANGYILLGGTVRSSDIAVTVLLLLTSFSNSVFLAISIKKIQSHTVESLTNCTDSDFHNTSVLLYSDALDLVII